MSHIPSRSRPVPRWAALALGGALVLSGLAATSAAADTADFRFDFNCGSSPTADGYVGVLPNEAYSAETGYGFDPALASDACRDRSGRPDPAERDFALPAVGDVFRVDVPNGTYTVVMRTGDDIASSNTGATFGGYAFPNIHSPSGQVAVHILDDVEVTTGQLAFSITGNSPRLNAIEILQPLAVPTGLTAQPNAPAEQVDLSWVASEGAQTYRVYRHQGSGDPVLVADVGETQWTDDDVILGEEYGYAVSAVTSGGRESGRTDGVTVTVADPAQPAPASPAGLTAAWGEGAIVVSWQHSEDALAYDVYRASGGLAPAFVARVTDTAWEDTAAAPSSSQSYQVAAVGLGGRSERSEVVHVDALVTLERQAERLDRSPVAVVVDDGVYLGWRLLGDDPADLGFHVYRDGQRITDEPITDTTNLLDLHGTADSQYRISAELDVERWVTEGFGPWQQQYLDLPIDRPAGGVGPDGVAYEYRANDVSIGDVDGDGELEIVLKWDPTNAKDNAHSGNTGNVYIDAYKLDGTQLWRIDLGRNIRAGAHYTQFQVFDFDGDGRAEIAFKTADGTIDGVGNVIGDPDADYRNSAGYILDGPEFLTIFDGETGEALDTVDYHPPRGSVSAWGDNYGNRIDRFLAGTAYLDGETPSLIVSRGYYTRTVIVAYDFDGEALTQRWVFDSDDEGSQYEGQGNHQLSIADVDGDQKDEIIFGSLTIDDDGSVLYNTTLGHGDALHVGNFDPSRPGLEVFSAHESMSQSGNRGATFRDAATGEILWSIPGNRDTGRAAMGDIDPRYEGAEGWAVGGDAAWNSPVGQLRSAGGELIAETIPAANHLLWWDGDLLREILDHDWDPDALLGVPTIAKWDYENAQEVEIYRATGTLSINGTKGNPSLQADLFGDWREEVITPLADSSALRIHTTVDVTDHRLRTLLSDPVYRLAIAWQNTSYNQPPHTSYFLGEGMVTPPAPLLAYTTEAPELPVVEVDTPAFETEVRGSCRAGRVFLDVQVQNTGPSAIDVVVETDFGTRAFADVAPGRSAYHSFTTRATSIGDGHVTITVTGEVGGDVVTHSEYVPYGPHSCQ